MTHQSPYPSSEASYLSEATMNFFDCFWKVTLLVIALLEIVFSRVEFPPAYQVSFLISYSRLDGPMDSRLPEDTYQF